MSKIDDIEAELKDLKEHPGNGTLVDCDSEREHQFWLKSRERIADLVEYVKAAEECFKGSPYDPDLDRLTRKNWLEAARAKLELGK